MDKPLTTTIIPVYKTEKYIQECLESVISQLPANAEVILVDDGSPDDAMRVAEFVIKSAPTKAKQFKIVTQQNMGLSSARNTGINHAKGLYITFLDSDDILLDNYFTAIHDLIIDNPGVEIISFNASVFCGNRHSKPISTVNTFFKKPSPTRKFGAIPDTFKSGEWQSCFRAFHNSLFLQEKFKIGIHYEDMELIPNLYLRAKSCVQSEFLLYGYRVNSQAITTNPKLKDLEDLAHILHKYADKPEKEDCIFVVYSALYTMHRLCAIINNAHALEIFHKARNGFLQSHSAHRKLYYSNLLRISILKSLTLTLPTPVFVLKKMRSSFKSLAAIAKSK